MFRRYGMNLPKMFGIVLVIIGVIGFAISFAYQYGYGQIFSVVLIALGFICFAVLGTIRDVKAKSAIIH